MDTRNTELDGSPPWVRLAWAGLRTLIANSAARDIVSEAPMMGMARSLFMTIVPHLSGQDDTADVGLPELAAAGVSDLIMFHWLVTNLPHGFCQIAVVDRRGNRLLGDAALDVIERYGPGLRPFCQVDLRQLRLSTAPHASPQVHGKAAPAAAA